MQITSQAAAFFFLSFQHGFDTHELFFFFELEDPLAFDLPVLADVEVYADTYDQQGDNGDDEDEIEKIFLPDGYGLYLFICLELSNLFFFFIVLVDGGERIGLPDIGIGEYAVI